MTKVSSRKLTVKNAEQVKTHEVKIMRIVESASSRSKKDIKDWRAALAMAEHHEKPRRRFLIDLYEELRLDAHIINLMNRYKRDVTQHPFLLRNKKSGKPDPEATKMLMKNWFIELLRYKQEANFFGHSLMQVKKIDVEGIKEIELINRRNVVPEFGSYIEDLSNDKLINYRDDPALNKYLFEYSAGSDNRFGYLNPCAPHILFKKNAMVAWSEFCEIFGLPIRYVVTDNRRKADIDRIEKALREMGKAAYGIFHTGEEMKFAETTRTDAFRVFDNLRLAANAEMGVMILGETMTTDVGANGSRAQAEVHQQTSLKASGENRMNTEIWVNETVMPKLNVFGYGLKNFEFYYPKQATFNPEEWTVYQGLLQHYDIDEKFFTEQYGVPITAKKQFNGTGEAGKSGGNEGGVPGKKKEPKPEDDEGEPAANSIKVLLNQLHFGCCTNPEIYLSESLFNQLLKSNLKLLESIYSNPQITDYGYQTATSNLLLEALWKGFKGKPATFSNANNSIGIDYNTPDYLAYTMMEANIHQFSAGKTVAMVQELNALARNHKTFEAFEKAANPVMDSYSKQYLNAEYNNVWATGQNAAEYHRMKADAELYPYWQYLTANDARVRDAHRALHGKVFKHDDAVWDTIYPPNGWNCRCYIKPLMNYNQERLSNEDEALNALAQTDSGNMSELDRMKKSGFDKNRAELKVAFTESQMYVKKFDGSKLGVKAYDLPKWNDIDKSKLPEVPTGKTKEDAQAWYDANVKDGVINDYAERKMGFEKSTLQKHLTEKYIQQGRQNMMDLLGSAIIEPDEVWLQRTSANSFSYLYILFTNENPLAVIADVTGNKSLSIQTWFMLSKQPDDARSGILVKKKKQ